MSAPIQTLHAIRMLAGLRMNRLVNVLTSATSRSFSRGRPKSAKRTAGTRPKLVSWLIAFGFTALILFTVINSFRIATLVMYCHAHPMCDVFHVEQARRSIGTLLHAAAFAPLMMRGFAVLLSLLWVLSVVYPLALANRAAPDWDMEWLATLPMSRTTLACARIVERGLVNATGWFTLGSCSLVLAWYANIGWLIPLYTVLLTLPLLMLAASLWTLLDLGLHIVLAPSRLRNLQAVLALLVAPVAYLIMSIGTPGGGRYMLWLTDITPQWIMWTPVGLAVQILSAQSHLDALGLYLLLLAETATGVLLSVVLLRYQLRAGLIVHGPRESGRRVGRRQPANMGRASWLSPLQRRELTMLLRDRRYLAQCLGVPLIMVGGQFMLNASLTPILMHRPAAIAAFSFGIAAYTLLWSALSTVITEGDKLWLLYTFPRSLASMLWEKTRFYMVLALPYPLAIFAVFATIAYLGPAHLTPTRYASGFVLTLAGVPIFATVALALGILSGIPPTPTSRQVGIRYVYLYMTLAGFYGYALTTDNGWYRGTIFLLCVALAYALWQKAADRLPFLYDAASLPPQRVSLADGLIATTIFFVIQILIFHLSSDILHGVLVARIITAYVGAGACTYAIMRAAFWSLKTRDLPPLLGPGVMPAIALGAALGLTCALIGLCYLWLAQRYRIFPESPTLQPLGPATRLGITALAVCAAPLFEEFVFRGLIFGGLRRSLDFPLAALASAALFALVHPPASMAPVFIVGLAAAWVYERKRMLAASMATHAVYNAVVVGYQLFLFHPG